MYLTNMVDKRTLEKYEKEAKEINRETWYLSWCMDTNAEERNKGKTVEVRLKALWEKFVQCPHVIYSNSILCRLFTKI